MDGAHLRCFAGALLATALAGCKTAPAKPLARCDAAQPSRLEILAGQPGASGWVDGSLRAAHFSEPWTFASDERGHVFVADLHAIRKIDLAAGTVTTLAGDARHAGAADGVGARAAFNAPCGLAFAGGLLYVADTENHALRAVDPESGAVTTVAGALGAPGAVDAVGGDARLREPEGLALDGEGNLYIGDTDNNEIRRFALRTRAVTTVAGAPDTAGTTDGVGAAARFNKPKALAFDRRTGTLFVVDSNNQSVRALLAATRSVSTLARFPAMPQGIAVGPGDVLVSLADHRLVRVARDGSWAPLAGRAGSSGAFVDGPPLEARFRAPAGLLVEDGTVYVADLGNSVVRTIALPDGPVQTFAGARSSGDDDGSAENARFAAPQGLAAAADRVFVADTGNSTIREIALDSGRVTTLAGAAEQTGAVDGTLEQARFHHPQGLAFDAEGRRLYVADTQNRRLRVVDLRAGSVSTLALQAAPGDPFHGFDAPSGVAFDAGRLFVADYTGHVVVAVDLAAKRATTLAGKYSTPGRADGVGGAARLYGPMGLAADGRGHLFVADDLNETVRQIDLATGMVSTLAGQPVVPGSNDGVGAAAHFHYPFGVAADCAGDVFVADSYSDTIRRVNVASGMVATIVGVEAATGVRAGPLPAQISHPSALDLLPSGGGLLLVSENAVLLAR